MAWANEQMTAFARDIVTAWHTVVSWFADAEPSSPPVRSSQ
jgi:hypothetical protein